MDRPSALRQLPKVDDVLRSEAGQRLRAAAPRWAVVRAVREEIDRLRQEIMQEREDGARRPQPEIDGERLRQAVERLLRPSLVRVLNGTGVVLHTNLGRAPLPAAALARIAEVAGGYSNLEYRLDAGRRGSRHEHLQGLLCALTGAEGHLVVNNNAAAVLLMLAGLCAGRQVVVSRGELVEIGGSFRIPDVMRASGARLCEVGTTNRTHRGDYEAALGPETAAFLKVHQSNFAVVGFTREVELAELCAAARRHGVLALCDLGSGALVPPVPEGRGLEQPPREEPTVARALAAGCDVVCFSGDKLLGGPQAGILAGRRELIDTLKKHPLMRALRPDKLALLALTATLELYRDAEPAVGNVPALPVLRMMATGAEELRGRAERLRRLCPEVPAEVRRVRSAVGGGSLPRYEPHSFALAIAGRDAAPARLEQALRRGTPPVVARIAEDRLLLDVRTIFEEDLETLAQALRTAYRAAQRAPADPKGGPEGATLA